MGRWPRSGKAKAEREVVRRREAYKMKRFNDPLKIFIEKKYPEIFGEYTEFYRYLHSIYPTRKSLMTSKTFKQWMKDNSTLTPLEPQLEVPLIPSKLAGIIVRLRKVESSLKQVKTIINEGEATSLQGIKSTSATQVHESIINEGEATSLQGIKPMNMNPPQTLESLIDELMEDDVWQELLNQDLSGIYEHIETDGGL